MRTLATAVILLLGVALIIVHHSYTSAISRALEEESTPVPVQVGPIDSKRADSLRFKIENVRRNQRVATNDQNGDDASSNWTVFDCIPDADPSASFRLALAPTPPVTGNSSVTSSEAILWVNDRSAGDRLISLLSDAWDQKEPPPASPPAALKTMKVSMAVLAQHLKSGDGGQIRSDDSDLPGSKRGNWTATRWSIDEDGLEAELWCNYNFSEGRGEFVRKNPDDGKDLLQAMAISLRDGPRPPRTPADDSSLVATGPHLRNDRRINTGPASSFFFTPGGSIILMTLDSGVSVSILQFGASTTPSPLAKFDGMLAGIVCADDEDNAFFVQESGSVAVDGMPWWQAPQHIWFIDRKKDQRKPIDGPWGDAGALAGPLALSPDRRYLIVSHRRTTSDGQRVRATYMYDIQTGESKKAEFEGSSEVIRWTGGPDDPPGTPMRALVSVGVGWRFSPDYQRQYYELDPVTGKNQLIDEMSGSDPQVSPDQALRFDLKPEERVDIIDNASNKIVSTFNFHPDDQRYAREGTISWLTPRYLCFRGKRQATIDVQTMKMCYLTQPDEKRMFVFDRNLRWAAGSDDKGLYVADVVVDTESAATNPITRVDPEEDSIND